MSLGYLSVADTKPLFTVTHLGIATAKPCADADCGHGGHGLGVELLRDSAAQWSAPVEYARAPEQTAFLFGDTYTILKVSERRTYCAAPPHAVLRSGLPPNGSCDRIPQPVGELEKEASMSAIPLGRPLKSREVEYPSSDGKPMAEIDLHRDEMIYVIEALQKHFRDAPDVYVSGNLLLYYVEGEPRYSISPDALSPPAAGELVVRRGGLMHTNPLRGP